jgi:hypothetical protein
MAKLSKGLLYYLGTRGPIPRPETATASTRSTYMNSKMPSIDTLPAEVQVDPDKKRQRYIRASHQGHSNEVVDSSWSSCTSKFGLG